MSSDPTDLIRAVDAALATSDGATVPVSRYLLRRLRDALRAEQKDSEIIATALSEERAYSAHLKDEVTRAKEWSGVSQWMEHVEVRRALAEANATIERVRALADEWMGDGANPRSFLKRIAGMALRRAIEGPAT